MTGRFRILVSWLRKVAAQFPYLLRALRLVWAAARGWTVAWAALLVVQGLLPAATVALTKLLVDSLVDVIETAGAQDAVLTTLLWVVLMGAVMLLNQLMGSATGWVQANQAELVRDHVTSLIHDKSVSVDLAFYDSPEYYDHLHRARAEAGFRPLSLLESLGALLQNGVTLVATSNTRPGSLYRDGLQRERFLPAIDLLQNNTRVVELGGGQDFRLELLQHGGTYLVDAGDSARDCLTCG